MATKIVTNKMRLHSARQIYESIDEHPNTAYYYFISNHDPEVLVPEDINRVEAEITFDPYQGMIAGKRISSSDIALAVKNIPYQSNTVYDMYDDQDYLLDDKNYFVITEEGSYFHVYKCLDNNMGDVSSVQPSFSHIVGANSIVYQTSDGYRWKYMYSVADTDKLKFSTANFFPVLPNTEVSNSAVLGAIDIIKVEGIGQGYGNYVEGTFSTSHIRVGGNSVLYEISNTTASSSNNFYNGCLLYLTAGDGAGQYSKISTYISNTSGKYIKIANAFVTSPTNGTDYEIYPAVNVFGTGSSKVNCVARALINALASNSVYRVEMIDRGSGYTYAFSANVVAHSTVEVGLPAEIRPINSPPNGHGSDAAMELASNSFIFSVKFSNTENDTIPAINSFKQIGIIKDPVFSNVSIEIKNGVGTFGVGEMISQVKPYRIEVSASINTTSANVDATNADFVNQFDVGDYVYLAANDDTAFQLTTISSITNSSQIVLNVNGNFNSSNCFIYKTNVYSQAYVNSSNTTHVLVSNVMGVFSTDDLFIANISGSVAQVNTIYQSNTAKGFSTYIGMYRYDGVLNSGSFQENEWVYQQNFTTDSNTVALLHSTVVVGSNITMYTTEQLDEFRVGGTNTVTGNTSSAVMRVDTKYPPEIRYGSGDVIFLENVDEITRSNTTSETFQTVITF